MFWPPGSIWETWSLPCGMATPNRTVNVPSESVLKAPSKGFIRETTYFGGKGKIRPSRSSKNFFLKTRDSRPAQPSPGNSRISTPDLGKIVPVWAKTPNRSSAFCLPRGAPHNQFREIVSPNFQLEKGVHSRARRRRNMSHRPLRGILQPKDDAAISMSLIVNLCFIL